MNDPFGLMQFAECEHQQLKCEKCGARSDIRGWSTFTGQNKEMCDLREANEQLTARLAAAESREQKLHDLYDELAQKRATIERERDEARGAMRADDERLRLAAARVGIVAGCDTPDEMADEIERLRALLQEAVAIWDAEPSYECVLPWRWFDEVKAALEGKP